MVAVLLGAVTALALSAAGCGVTARSESGSEASISITGVYPDFEPAEARYVSRCGRGTPPIRVEAGQGTRVAVGSAAPRTGAVRVDPEVRPGEDFTIAA